MFGFGKKPLVVQTPAAGRILDITEVPDAVFSQKMMGDGFAVVPADETDTIAAPCDSRVLLVPGTQHAIALASHGVEMLIHIGLDTAELQGKGFRALVKTGDTVRRGMPLIKFDRAYIEQQGKSLITMLVLTNMSETVKTVTKDLLQPSAVLTVALK